MNATDAVVHFALNALMAERSVVIRVEIKRISVLVYIVDVVDEVIAVFFDFVVVVVIFLTVIVIYVLEFVLGVVYIRRGIFVRTGILLVITDRVTFTIVDFFFD